VISNFHKIRRDGKVIPEGMTGVEMIAAGWEPDKVLWLRWDCDGHPTELASHYGLLSRVVPSHEYVAVLEDTDATGDHATLRVHLADGTIRESFSDIVDFPASAKFGARKEERGIRMVSDAEVAASDGVRCGLQGLSQRRNLSGGDRRRNGCSSRNRRDSLGPLTCKL